MTTMITTHRVRAVAALLGALLTLPGARAQGQAGQAAVITGKVTSEFGQPIEGAQVYMNEFAGMTGTTNAQGSYSITIPAARVLGQAVNLRVRAIGAQPGVRPIRITAGSQTADFTLKQDINRLSEVVVTGSVEATERSKVPFSVAHIGTEDIPVPALDPIRAIQGKVPGLRISQAGGGPGSSPEILMRGPTSINASGRSQQPLLIVDGVKIIGSLDELGGLDIESVEVVKGAAGGSVYGTTAANGVIVVKTKRGNNQEGVRFNVRSEIGTSDFNSLNYGMPLNHPLQLDETGKRFCVAGNSNIAPCSRTVDWMQEIMRINNVNADTVRTGYNVQWGQPGGTDLLNVYQAEPWPGKYYNTFAQITTRNPQTINSVDASGRIGTVRFYVSGAYTDDKGSVKIMSGQQQRRGRVNLDYDIKNNFTVSVSSLYDRGYTDLHSAAFGTLLRGATPGTDYTARDTLGRLLVRGVGPTSRPTGNGAGAFLYNLENEKLYRVSERYQANLTSNYFPTDWVTFEATFGYDHRHRLDNDFLIKGYRTSASTVSTSTNFGNGSINDRNEEAYNGSVGATFRKQITNDLSGRFNVKGSYDSDYLISEAGSGEQLIVKDIYTLSNTTQNKTATSSSSSIRNMGGFMGAQADYKGKYIVDGTYRYDGSSLFGAGNRWAPFGRVSAVWRMSEESWFHVPKVSDFRLRASRGTAGSTPSFTAQYETYSCSVTGCSLGQAGNKKLMPETTTEVELGTDFTLFSRLGVEITKADGSTRNQILNVPTPASLGFSNQWQNAGTLANHTWELALNLPVINRRDLQWSTRGTWDRTRTYITQLFMPEYFTSGGTGQGTGSFFLITARRDIQDGAPVNRYGNLWGRKFYKTCGDLPGSVQSKCGPNLDYQVDDRGWVVWVGAGNSYKDGITKNLWQTKLPAAASPWNYPLQFGHPIIDRPLLGQPGEGIGNLHILGHTLPDFNLGWSNNLTYRRLTLYGLFQGTFGQSINNQGEAWGLLDFSSANFDQANATVETAKPLGYSWRVGGGEGAGTGGFYDQLGPNNYNVESGSYLKLRELSLTYKVGAVKGFGDWTVGVIGRNLKTFTNYSGYDPETGVAGGGQANSGIINQTDAFDFPTPRTYTITLSTRF